MSTQRGARFTLILDDKGERALKTLLRRAEEATKRAGLNIKISRNALIQSLIVGAIETIESKESKVNPLDALALRPFYRSRSTLPAPRLVPPKSV